LALNLMAVDLPTETDRLVKTEGSFTPILFKMVIKMLKMIDL